MTQSEQAAAVVDFWRQAGPEHWFAKDADFDARFRDQFLGPHFAAARRERDDWAETAEGTLALILLLDQFPRNVFRGSGHMYATDPLARMFARDALDRDHDQAFEPDLRLFMYLPFSHSEELEDQELAVRLSATLEQEAAYYARHHRDIIRRFGRFPHRNPLLGRDTTPAEQAFLNQGGFTG